MSTLTTTLAVPAEQAESIDFDGRKAAEQGAFYALVLAAHTIRERPMGRVSCDWAGGDAETGEHHLVASVETSPF